MLSTAVLIKETVFRVNVIKGSIYFSGKLTTYPSLNLTLTLTSHFGQNVGLGEGLVVSFPETYIEPNKTNKQVEINGHFSLLLLLYVDVV